MRKKPTGNKCDNYISLFYICILSNSEQTTWITSHYNFFSSFQSSHNCAWIMVMLDGDNRSYPQIALYGPRTLATEYILILWEACTLSALLFSQTVLKEHAGWREVTKTGPAAGSSHTVCMKCKIIAWEKDDQRIHPDGRGLRSFIFKFFILDFLKSCINYF